VGTFFALSKLILVTAQGDLVLLDPSTGKIIKTLKLEHQNLTRASVLLFPGTAFCVASAVPDSLKFYPLKDSLLSGQQQSPMLLQSFVEQPVAGKRGRGKWDQ